MGRKVQRFGTAEGITLPVEWTREMGIKKGQELDVAIRGNKLIVSMGESEVSKCKIHISSTNETLVWWVVVPIYELGYDEIEVSFDNPNTILILNEMAKSQLGCVISEKTENKCVLKSIAKETEFEAVFDMAFDTAISLGEQSLDLIKKGDMSKLKATKSLEYSLNSYVGFCTRMLTKYGYKVPKHTSVVFSIVKHLEFIGDMLDDLNENLIQFPKLKITKEFVGLYEKMIETLRKAHKIFYKCTEKELEEFIKFREGILSDIQKSKDPLTVMVMRPLRRAVSDFVPPMHSLHH